MEEPSHQILKLKVGAPVPGFSPNRVSELTKTGQLQAASVRPLRYAVEHNRSCYENYSWAVRVGSSLAKLSLKD